MGSYYPVLLCRTLEALHHFCVQKNSFPSPIWFKANFITIPNLIWSELGIMEVIRKCFRIVKCRLGGWCIFRLVGVRFVGAIEIMHTLGFKIHVVYLMGYLPR